MMEQLPDDLIQAIRLLMATGKYSSQEELLREALVALRQRDEGFEAIAAGIADMEAGRYRPFADVDAEFR